jgi:hypothetical protein
MSEERIRRDDPLHRLPWLLEACCRSIRPPFDSLGASSKNQLRSLGSHNPVVGLLCIGRSI